MQTMFGMLFVLLLSVRCSCSGNDGGADGGALPLTWARGRMFQKEIGQLFAKMIEETGVAFCDRYCASAFVSVCTCMLLAAYHTRELTSCVCIRVVLQCGGAQQA